MVLYRTPAQPKLKESVTNTLGAFFLLVKIRTHLGKHNTQSTFRTQFSLILQKSVTGLRDPKAL